MSVIAHQNSQKFAQQIIIAILEVMQQQVFVAQKLVRLKKIGTLLLSPHILCFLLSFFILPKVMS